MWCIFVSVQKEMMKIDDVQNHIPPSKSFESIYANKFQPCLPEADDMEFGAGYCKPDCYVGHFPDLTPPCFSCIPTTMGDETPPKKKPKLQVKKRSLRLSLQNEETGGMVERLEERVRELGEEVELAREEKRNLKDQNSNLLYKNYRLDKRVGELEQEKLSRVVRLEERVRELEKEAERAMEEKSKVDKEKRVVVEEKRNLEEENKNLTETNRKLEEKSNSLAEKSEKLYTENLELVEENCKWGKENCKLGERNLQLMDENSKLQGAHNLLEEEKRKLGEAKNQLRDEKCSLEAELHGSKTVNQAENLWLNQRVDDLEQEILEVQEKSEKETKQLTKAVKNLQKKLTDHEKALEEQQSMVECPVCLMLPREGPTVPCCPQGHFICSQCLDERKAQDKQDCPTCRGPMREGRSLLAFTVVKQAKHECTLEGCSAVVPFDEIKEHEERCNWRLVICPGSTRSCNVMVPFQKAG